MKQILCFAVALMGGLGIWILSANVLATPEPWDGPVFILYICGLFMTGWICGMIKTDCFRIVCAGTSLGQIAYMIFGMTRPEYRGQGLEVIGFLSAVFFSFLAGLGTVFSPSRNKVN